MVKHLASSSLRMCTTKTNSHMNVNCATRYRLLLYRKLCLLIVYREFVFEDTRLNRSWPGETFLVRRLLKSWIQFKRNSIFDSLATAKLIFYCVSLLAKRANHCATQRFTAATEAKRKRYKL